MEAVGASWEEELFGQWLWVVEMILKESFGVFEGIIVQILITNRTCFINRQQALFYKDFRLWCFENCQTLNSTWKC